MLMTGRYQELLDLVSVPYKQSFVSAVRGAHSYGDMGNCPRHVLGPSILKITWWVRRAIPDSQTAYMRPRHVF